VNHHHLSFCIETPASERSGLFGSVAKVLCAARKSEPLLALSCVVMMLGLLSPSAANAQAVINYPGGFANSGSQIWLEAAAKLSGSSIQLTANSGGAANNVWYKTPVNVEAFTTTFTWTVTCPTSPTRCGDGMGFMIISDPNATPAGFTYSGDSGAQFSWSRCGGTGTIQCPSIDSVLVKFDLYNNETSAEGNFTGFYSGGAYPQAPNNPQYDMASSGINMQSGHLMRGTLTYNGTVLTEKVTDTVTGATYTKNYTANIPSLVAGNTAYVGFGGGTGAATATQNLESWTYTVESSGKAVSPTISPAGGTYSAPQSVRLSSESSGTAICYNTTGSPAPNGSNGCASGTLYTGPVSVSSNETLYAVAGGSGYGNSPVATGDFVIQASASAQAAPPTFSPAGGAYSASQSVKLTSASPGSTICYSTTGSPKSNGSNGCTSGTPYTGPVTISSSEALYALAGGTGYNDSSVASANYVMQSSSAQPVINYPSGFAGSTGQIWLESFASLSGAEIHLVPSVVHNASNAWYETPQNIQAFTTTFTFRVDCSASPTNCGDGLGFMIICACTGGNYTYDPANGRPGYTYAGFSSGQFSWSECRSPFTPASTYCYGYTGSNLTELPANILVKFDLYNNQTNQSGANITGYYTGGEYPQAPYAAQYDMSASGINMQSGDLFSATLAYNGTTLTETLTDTKTNAVYTKNYAANIPAAIRGNTGFVGFGGGTGAALDDVYIDSWTYTAE
jgi:hypothetical protein